MSGVGELGLGGGHEFMNIKWIFCDLVLSPGAPPFESLDDKHINIKQWSRWCGWTIKRQPS